MSTEPVSAGREASAPTDRPDRANPGVSRKVPLAGVLIALAAGLAVFAWTANEQTWSELRRLRQPLLALPLLLVPAAWLCAALRLRVLTAAVDRRLSIADCVGVNLAAELGVTASPMGLGGPPVYVYLLNRRGMPIGTGISIVAAEAALDLISALVILPLAFWAGSARGLAPAAVAPAAAAAVWLAAPLAAATGAPHLRLGARLRSIGRMLRLRARETRQGLATLLDAGPRRFAAALGWTALRWTCRYSVLPVIFIALSLPMDPLELLWLQALLLLGGMLIPVPGGGGGVEVGAGLLLGGYAPQHLVGAVVLLWRLFTYHLYVAGGAVAMSLMLRRRADRS